MDINRSALESAIPPSKTAERLRAGFVLAMGGLLSALRRILLPHLLVSLGLFTVAGYAVYKALLGPLHLPFPLSWLIAFCWLGGYALLAFIYALALSAVFAVRSSAIYAEDFFYALFESLKERVREKIKGMDEGIAKQQAKVILDNSVRETLAPLKAFRFASAPQAAAGILLGVLTLVSRSVFLARLARLSGTTVNFSAVFASRATLVGALFLNMRWLASLVLWVLYSIGAAVLILNVCLII